MYIESKCRFSAPFSSRKSIRKGRQHQQLKTPAAISYIFIYKFYFLAAGFDDEFQCIIPATTTERRESRARNKQQQTHSMNSLRLLIVAAAGQGYGKSRETTTKSNNNIIISNDIYTYYYIQVIVYSIVLYIELWCWLLDGAKIKLKSPHESSADPHRTSSWKEKKTQKTLCHVVCCSCCWLCCIYSSSASSLYVCTSASA